MNESQALLAQLGELEVPEVSGWPAIGWWLLAGLVCIVIGAAIWLRWQVRRSAWRREARAVLSALRDDVEREPADAVLARCSALARRLLLCAEPRSSVAALHGEPWLASLDRAAGQPLFTQGFGRLLLEQPYQRSPQVPAHDLLALIDSLEILLGAIRYRAAP